MISFCHGQEHQAEAHKHLLLVTTDLDKVQIFFDTGEKISNGMRHHLVIDSMEISIWFLTPEYEHVSALNRLLRTIDIIILHYSEGSIPRLEEWYHKFQSEKVTISVIEQFHLLEEMNEMFGTISTPNALFECIKKMIST